MSYSVNKVWLLGNAGADAVSNSLGNGNNVVKVTLATTRGWMEESGWKEVTDWHNVAFFGKLAEKALKIKKGMLFSVVGRNQTFAYEKDGIKRYRTEVVVDMKGELEIIGYPSHSRPERSQRSPAAPQPQQPASQPPQQSPHLPDDWRDGEFGQDDFIPF
ncbi:single-stranded DNA-binding protein [Pseudomonas aeruginosa]|uniref:single-stranded DNA-binding protein n=1 Tax=Pseudomonas aeruginosa TaxID=287 RepID=UPI002B2772AE|nr:single-stranded DNA-binding protein [Pseudomonas aeruginosa]MEA8592574.1 single-stranded DNA-binding protein [Pseudomonas aeruginosa]